LHTLNFYVKEVPYFVAIDHVTLTLDWCCHVKKKNEINIQVITKFISNKTMIKLKWFILRKQNDYFMLADYNCFEIYRYLVTMDITRIYRLLPCDILQCWPVVCCKPPKSLRTSHTFTAYYHVIFFNVDRSCVVSHPSHYGHNTHLPPISVWSFSNVDQSCVVSC
jgi:hypothetical protein